jgi:hypothetical protein
MIESEESVVVAESSVSVSKQVRKDKRKATTDQQSEDPFFDDAPFVERPKQARTVIRSATKSGYSLTDSLQVKSTTNSEHRQSSFHTTTSAVRKQPASSSSSSSSSTVDVDIVSETVAAVATQCASSPSFLQQAQLCMRTLVEAAVNPDGLQKILTKEPHGQPNSFYVCVEIMTAYECMILASVTYLKSNTSLLSTIRSSSSISIDQLESINWNRSFIT